MTDPSPLPDFLTGYLEKRAADRASAVTTFLASLTPWERALFHDAAVMGYVQGLMRDRAEGCPKDSQVMALVVDACLAFPDAYPAVNVDRADVAQLRAAAAWITNHTYEGIPGDGQRCTADFYGETCGRPWGHHELREEEQ